MKKSTTLAFTGDIGFDAYFTGKWDDPEVLSQDILDFLRSADHVVANVEGAILDPALSKDGGGKGMFFHTMDPRATKVLDDMHADIWNLANNHTLDGGLEGIQSTLDAAKEHGALHCGAGLNIYDAMEPVILDEAGGIGILGLGFMETCVRATPQKPGCFPFDELDRIEAAVKKVKEKCRWCVLVVHAGEEFSCMPAPYTRDLYLKYLSFGADIIVSHHPHVARNYELLPGKAIFYSLGNFIFDTNYQRAQQFTDRGVLLKINFTEKDFSFEAQGTRIERGIEHVVAGELPDIFADVQEEEYLKLIPTAAAAFIKAEKKKCCFSKPDTFVNAAPETWDAYFSDYKRGNRIPKLHHDLPAYLELAEKADEAVFDSSKLEGVKAYIRELL